MSLLLYDWLNGPTERYRGPNHHYWFGGHHPFMQNWLEQWLEQNPEDGFEVKLNVANYAPSEIKIKLNGRTLTVEGEHNHDTEHGCEMRKFMQTVTVPPEFNIDALTSKLNQNGVLCVTAPKLNPEQGETKEKTIPIQMEEAKKIENKK